MNRELFDEKEEDIVDAAIEAMAITAINYKDDTEMETLTTKLIAVDCILHSSLSISEDKRRTVEEQLSTLFLLIPKSNTINDYPKAIQFRNMIEKMKDDFVDVKFMYHIDKVIGDDGIHFLVCFLYSIIYYNYI